MEIGSCNDMIQNVFVKLFFCDVFVKLSFCHVFVKLSFCHVFVKLSFWCSARFGRCKLKI